MNARRLIVRGVIMLKNLSSVLSFIKDSWKSHMIGFIITGILLIIPDSWFISAVGYSIPNYLKLVILILFILSSILICFDLIFCKTEEQKNDIEYRRGRIVKWRNMINEIIKEHDKIKEKNKINIKVSVLLERHKDYYSLMPHLSEKTLCQLCRATEITLGSTISPPLEFVLDDITRLEKEWGLI